MGAGVARAVPVRLNGGWTTTGRARFPLAGHHERKGLGRSRMSTIYRVTPGERMEGQPTQGIVREQAVETAGMWAGLARTDAGMVSGWHHHGEYESAIYVLTGSLRMEFGSAGEETFDAEPGDFVFVGKD